MTTVISTLVVKIAELCNLNCTYCYMYNHEDQSYKTRPKHMSNEVYENLLQRVKEYCTKMDSKMTLGFHGGEPLLIGVERFEQMVERAREVLGDQLEGIAVQTNATLINEKWQEMFTRQRMPVSISLDGPPEINDACRVDHAGKGSHSRIMRGLDFMRKHPYRTAVLCVVNPEHSGLATYKHFRDLGFTKINFLFPDTTHDSKERWYGGLGETPVADYLLPIFDDWLAEDNPNIVIQPFWSLLRQISHLNIQNEGFGNPKMGYLVIETDGEITPIDVLRVCESGMIKTGLNVAEHGFTDLNLASSNLLQRLVEGEIPLSETCQKCEVVDRCGGGYIPHRYSRERGFDNPSAWCADIKKMMHHIEAKYNAPVSV